MCDVVTKFGPWAIGAGAAEGLAGNGGDRQFKAVSGVHPVVHHRQRHNIGDRRAFRR
jgi:hypothetical protein